jgi:hypothetical protein
MEAGEALRKIAVEDGKEILLDARRVYSYLADYKIENRYRNQIKMVLETMHLNIIIRNVPKVPSRATQQQSIERLVEDTGYPETVIHTVTGWIFTAMGLKLEVPSVIVDPPRSLPSPLSVNRVTKDSVIKFGAYDWRVLDVQSGRALIISKEILEEKPYNEKFEDTTREQCTLRKYLNNEFYNKFNSSEKAKIAETTLPNNDNPWFGTKGGNNTKDRIFLLSLEEVVKYFGDSGQLKNRPSDDAWYIDDQYNSARIAKLNGSARWWWLRSPGDFSYGAAFVTSDGIVHVGGHPIHSSGGGGAGVRPALFMNLKS